MIEKASLRSSYFIFALLYPIFLYIIGYIVVKFELDLGGYPNIIALGGASIVCERWFARINKRTFIFNEIIKITIFAGFYNLLIQYVVVIIFYGFKKALIENIITLFLVSIGHAVIIFLGFLFLSTLVKWATNKQ